MDCIILAGGRCDDDLKAATGCELRSELEIDGEPIFHGVVEACRSMGNVILVGGPEEAYEGKRVPAGSTFLESLKQGLGASTAEVVMIATADLPDLSAEAVSEVRDHFDEETDFVYPIVDAELCRADYPGMSRTTLRLKEGEFTGGNLAVIRREALERSLSILEQAYRDRKNPYRLARTIGLRVLLRLAVGKFFPRTLSVRHLESDVGRFLRMRVRAAPCRHASIGADIDSAEQLQAYLTLRNQRLHR